MADPILGNKADELGQFEQGKDFAGINEATLSEPTPHIPVRVTEDADSITLQRLDKPASEKFYRGIEELREGPDAITKAQVLDDPFMETGGSPEAIMQGAIYSLTKLVAVAMRKTPQRDKLIYYEVRPGVQMASFGERIIVMQDTLESEYSCRECHGKGYDPEEKCIACNGVQAVNNEACKACTVLGFDFESPWSCGRKKCTACRGSGWKNGIIIPQIAQSKPVTGIVVSVGPECMNLRIGDRVVHSKYAGQTLTTPTGQYTTMLESEVTSLLRDSGDKR